MYPWAPKLSAVRTISDEDSWLRKSNLAWGASLRIRCATSNPCSFGKLISSRIKSGCSSSAFCTASKSIRRLDGLELRSSLKRRTNETAEWRMVLDDENPQHMDLSRK